jgi:importin subunit beta-1
MDSF